MIAFRGDRERMLVAPQVLLVRPALDDEARPDDPEASSTPEGVPGHPVRGTALSVHPEMLALCTSISTRVPSHQRRPEPPRW